MGDMIPGPDSRNPNSETTRRRLLKGAGATAGVAAYELWKKQTGAAKLQDIARAPFNQIPLEESPAEKPLEDFEQSDKKEGADEKIDLSWMTREHVEDLLGMLYHGHNVGALISHASEGWKRDQYGNATIEKAPWGGPCTILYTVHRNLQEVGNLKADILTFEHTVYDFESPRRHMREVATAVSPEELPLLENNPESPCFSVDIRPSTTRLWANLVASAIVETQMFTAGLEALIKNPLSVGNSALVTYLMSGGAAISGRVAAKTSGKGYEISAIASRIASDIPTAFTLLQLKLRETFAAEKNEYIARLYSKEKPAGLATVWGAGHPGIETTTLQSSADRLRTLRLWKPLIKIIDANPKVPEHLWTCPEMGHFKDAKGEMRWRLGRQYLEVPTLKALFDDKE